MIHNSGENSVGRGVTQKPYYGRMDTPTQMGQWGENRTGFVLLDQIWRSQNTQT